MTDEEFAARFHELVAQGPAAQSELMVLFKAPGNGFSRLARLIPKPKKKRPPSKTPGMPLPFDFPDAAARATATDYWTRHGRADLVEQIDRIVDHFRTHHTAAETKAKSWPRTWTTWYTNQIEFVRRPALRPGHDAAGVIFEQTTMDGWVRRLEIEAESGIWRDVWGAKRGEPNSRVPDEAGRIFDTRHGRRQA